MAFLSIILIAIGLSADCFAVALGTSCADRNISRFKVVRIASSFGFFQALMPLIGWLAGKTIVGLIEHYDHWVAFALLAFVGGRMLWESYHHKKEDKQGDISRGLMLLTLSVATSLDALAVGLSFAFLEVNIWLAIAVIGATAFAISIIGFLMGRKVGQVFGKRAEAIGGLILLGIGLRILITHLMG